MVYAVIFLLAAAACVLVRRLCRGKDRTFGRGLMFRLCGVAAAVYVLSKVVLLFDPLYMKYNDVTDFIQECLPFHLCYLFVIVLPVTVLTDNRWLKAFSFCICPVGAVAAILFPDSFFAGRSVFGPVFSAFLFYHMLIAIIGLCFYASGLYLPSYTDILRADAVLLLSGGVSWLINVLFGLIWRGTDYFYTVSPAGNGILKEAWSLVPLPYFYLLPLVAAAQPVIIAVVFAVRLLDRYIKEKQ